MKVNHRRGFTLIELLVVLAIIATLATLVAPRLTSRVDHAREVVLRENLRTTRDAIGKFFGDHGRYPDNLSELVERRYLTSLPFDPLTESNATWVLLPAPAGYRGLAADLRSGAPGYAKDGSAYATW